MRRKTFYLKVDKVHNLWVDDTGPEDSVPMIECHGGPGAPMSDSFKKFIPKGFRVITWHQRGCGKSTPLGSLYKNKTFELVKDMEKIRKKLGIKKWYVSGGSFGATLAVTYAIKHPNRVKGLLLTGLSLFNDQMEKSTRFMAPDVYEKWKIKDTERGTFKFFLKKLKKTSKERKIYGKKWVYEDELFKIMKYKKKFTKRKAHAQYYINWVCGLLECYYYMNLAFLPKNWILKNAHRLKKIPGAIIHGRGDLICTPTNSFELSKVWKKGTLIMTNAGHSWNDINNYNAIQKVYKRFLKSG